MQIVQIRMFFFEKMGTSNLYLQVAQKVWIKTKPGLQPLQLLEHRFVVAWLLIIVFPTISEFRAPPIFSVPVNSVLGFA